MRDMQDSVALSMGHDIERCEEFANEAYTSTSEEWSHKKKESFWLEQPKGQLTSSKVTAKYPGNPSHSDF